MTITLRLLASSTFLASFAALTVPAGAQVISRAFLEHYRFEGTVNDNLGRSVAGAGDVNQDGFADVIVGASKATSPQGNRAGAAYIYSGKDGTQLWRFDGGATGDSLGISVAGAGDVNNDGFPDVIVGARLTDPGGMMDAGSAYVYSGKDGTELWQFDGVAAVDYLGSSVAGAGDVNQDGCPAIIVGAPNARVDGKPGRFCFRLLRPRRIAHLAIRWACGR